MDSIDKGNISTVLPLLNHDSSTIQDIQSAVAAGKVVTTSQSKVSVNGWTGSGYIILDPATGAGAYMIAGGANGGWLEWIKDNSTYLAFGLAVLGVALKSPFSIIAGVLGVVLTVATLYWAYIDAMADPKCPAMAQCIQGVFLIVASVGVTLAIIGIQSGLSSLVSLLVGDALALGITVACDSYCRPLPEDYGA